LYNNQNNAGTSAQRPTFFGMFRQMPATNALESGHRDSAIEAALSELAQVTIGMGNHITDHLALLIQTFGEDLVRARQQAQRLQEAVRQDPIRQYQRALALHTIQMVQQHPQVNSSVAHSHPVQPVPDSPDSVARSYIVVSPGSEHRTGAEPRSLQEDQESEDESNQDGTVHMRGGSGEYMEIPDELEAPREPVSSGEPMSMSEFDRRICELTKS